MVYVILLRLFLQGSANMFDGEEERDPGGEGIEGENEDQISDTDQLSDLAPDAEVQAMPPPSAPIIPSTPIANRRLGQFMTPQVPHAQPFAPATAVRPMHTPRRAADAWRVRDLVLPPNPQPAIAPRPPTSRKISAEEEQEIRARRKSALLVPLSPIKPVSKSTTSLSQIAEPSPAGPSTLAVPQRRPPRESDESDSGALLESMRRTVDDLRRRSLGTTLTPGPQSLSPRKKGGFSLFPVPADEMPVHKGALDFGRVSKDDDSMEIDDDDDGSAEDDKENVHYEAKPSAVGNGTVPAIHRTTPMPPPETPDLAPLRHMFAVPRAAGAATPAVKSIRGLYAQPRLPETPAMDGVAEMLAPPPPPPIEPEGRPDPNQEVKAISHPTQTRSKDQTEVIPQLVGEKKLTESSHEPELELNPSAPAPPLRSSRSSSSKPPSRTSASSKPASSSRPSTRPGRAPTASTSRSKVEMTPNASAMADDELTPAVPEAPSRRSTTLAKSTSKPAAATVKRNRWPPGLRPHEVTCP